ncbi:MAG TPA: M28 family peptidase [Terriglobales bacterium]|nr:M28 family peptidase [Terriglobales bacterium]
MRRLPVLLATPVVLAGMVFTVAAVKPPAPKAQKSHKAKANDFGNADAITQEELKDYDYFLASDQLQGRNLPSRGYDIAALYVASHLNEWGLKPGGSTTGTNGPLQPYFMPIDLVTTQPNPGGMKLTVTIPEARAGRGGRGGGFGRGAAQLTPGPHMLRYGHDWMVNVPAGRNAPPLQGADIANANLVFAGNGYVIGSDNPYQGLDVRGKVVVVAGVPPALASYQEAMAAARGRRGGAAGTPPANPMGPNDLTPVQYASKNGALAVITIPSFQQLTAMAAPDAGALRFGANGPNYSVTKFLPGQDPSVPEIVAGLDTVNALFQGERLSAAQVFDGAGANKPLGSFAFSPEKTISATVAVNTAHNHGENVIGELEGSDPVLKNEYVIMSAHLDHIGLAATPAGCIPDPELSAADSTGDGFPMTAPAKCDNINNGADDDGSGSTGLLGIAHAFAEGAAKGMRPKRTIIFLWNAGEEKGLWGSQYFNEFPPIDLSKVVVDLNMDMIGRDKRADSVDPDPSHYLVDPGGVLVVGPNISSNDLEATLESVNNNFQKLKLDHFYDVTAPDATHDNLGPNKATGQRIFYRSDHYNFAKMGIPIAFFSDGLHVDYHRPTDSPDKIDFQMIQQVAKTAAATAWVIGNEPEGKTPKLNATLPPLLVRDMAAAKAAGWGQLTPVLPPLPGEPF